MNSSAPIPDDAPSPAARPRTSWLVFGIVLLTPAIASCIAGALDSRNGGVAPAIVLVGGGIAGIICGATLGRRFGKTTPSKIILGVILSLLMAVACIGMSCFGCLAGGYKMSFN